MHVGYYLLYTTSQAITMNICLTIKKHIYITHMCLVYFDKKNS